MNLVKQIQIFGDSIMRGTLLNPITKRYCTNTEPLKRFEACFALQIRNQSRFGNTIPGAASSCGNPWTGAVPAT